MNLKFNIRAFVEGTTFSRKKPVNAVIDAVEPDFHRIFKLTLSEQRNKLLTNIIHHILRYMKYTVKHGWNYRYTRSLASSFHSTPVHLTEIVRKDGVEFYGTTEIFSTHLASSILETGGTIHSRSGKHLRVPAKHTPWYINYPVDTDFTLRGIQYKKLGSITIPAYILKDRVHIPAYRYLTYAIERWKYEE